jgi:transcriptional regulator with XRE-family HTH domain
VADSDRKEAKNPLGPAGARVAYNVRRLRQQQGLTFKDLSGRLEQLGRPIPVLGLSRLERGERRVDADDLVALAVALGCSPNTLLLPEIELSGLISIEDPLTSKHRARVEDMWAWATGEVPLGERAASANDDEAARRAEVEFLLVNRPHHHPVATIQRLTAVLEQGGDIAAGQGLTAATVVQWLALMSVSEAFKAGQTSAEIRSTFEALISILLLRPDRQPRAAEMLAETFTLILRDRAARAGGTDHTGEGPRE